MSTEPPPSVGPAFVRVLAETLHEWDEHVSGCEQCTSFQKSGSKDVPCESGANVVRVLLELIA